MHWLDATWLWLIIPLAMLAGAGLFYLVVCYWLYEAFNDHCTNCPSCGTDIPKKSKKKKPRGR